MSAAAAGTVQVESRGLFAGRGSGVRELKVQLGRELQNARIVIAGQESRSRGRRNETERRAIDAGRRSDSTGRPDVHLVD